MTTRVVARKQATPCVRAEHDLPLSPSRALDHHSPG
jgi:hypothetical protein